MASNDVKTATLAGQLQHFAQSVDIVDDRTFEAVRRLVYRYVTTSLKGRYFELMREQPIGNGDRQLWVKTFWSSQDREHLWQVKADQNNPVVEAFNAGRPLWLLDTGKEPLGDAGRYHDQWSGLTGMAAYQPSAPPIRTLVAVPCTAVGSLASTSSRSLTTSSSAMSPSASSSAWRTPWRSCSSCGT